jgi:hypothetical protein
MKKEWILERGAERFSVVVRSISPSGVGVVYEIERRSAPKERLGEIHEHPDGTFRTASCESEGTRKALEVLIPLIQKKFHSATARLRKTGG